MIKIKEPKKNTTRKSDPYYLLIYNYMIGDANGETTEEVKVSVDNPYVEEYCKLLSKLRPTKGTWGIVLEDDILERLLEEKQITQEEYEFLDKTMFPDWSAEEEDDYLLEFSDGVRGQTEYSFLVFQGIELFYVDEYGNQKETEFK